MINQEKRPFIYIFEIIVFHKKQLKSKSNKEIIYVINPSCDYGEIERFKRFRKYLIS